MKAGYLHPAPWGGLVLLWVQVGSLDLVIRSHPQSQCQRGLGGAAWSHTSGPGPGGLHLLCWELDSEGLRGAEGC